MALWPDACTNVIFLSMFLYCKHTNGFLRAIVQVPLGVVCFSNHIFQRNRVVPRWGGEGKKKTPPLLELAELAETAREHVLFPQIPGSDSEGRRKVVGQEQPLEKDFIARPSSSLSPNGRLIWQLLQLKQEAVVLAMLSWVASSMVPAGLGRAG